jgi:hypothetical protein
MTAVGRPIGRPRALTPRTAEQLDKLLAAKLPQQVCARALDVSLSTVSRHVRARRELQPLDELIENLSPDWQSLAARVEALSAENEALWGDEWRDFDDLVE